MSLFGSPYHKACSTWGSILGSPYFGFALKHPKHEALKRVWLSQGDWGSRLRDYSPPEVDRIWGIFYLLKGDYICFRFEESGHASHGWGCSSGLPVKGSLPRFCRALYVQVTGLH